MQVLQLAAASCQIMAQQLQRRCKKTTQCADVLQVLLLLCAEGLVGPAVFHELHGCGCPCELAAGLREECAAGGIQGGQLQPGGGAGGCQVAEAAMHTVLEHLAAWQYKAVNSE
jgi:hypothetical protein